MPYALTVPLKTQRTLSHSGGVPERALHALFYRWLEAAEPRLANFVHDQADPKPFTLSPLIDDGEERFHFRVTLLEDQYWDYVQAGLRAERTVRVGQKILALSGEPQVVCRSYADLAQSADPQWMVILRFESPMSFKSHDMHYPLPDPALVFASYRARWNAFAPELLHIDDDWMEWLVNNVAVSRFELRTTIMDFDRHQQIGCLGTIQYEVMHRGPQSVTQRGPLNALADYAFFCGTGHKTTQGLGQTQRLEHWPFAPGKVNVHPGSV